jgi:3-oxoacyl-[acyl-carrier protein] reductase
MTHSVYNRVAFITGGSKGIGKGIARVLAQAGARVAITSRKLSDAKATALEIGNGAIGLEADVRDLKSLEKAVHDTISHFGGLDILCANAGIFPTARLETMTSDQWDETMDVNSKGTFHAVQAAIPALKKSDQPRIIITSSITGPITGYPGWSHYGASKSAQLGFMRTAALELARYGITVNAVLPGNIKTEGFAGNGEAYIKAAEAAVPLRRLGTVEDIGHAALYFASKEAAYVTGQTLTIDGGQTLPESPEALAMG